MFIENELANVQCGVFVLQKKSHSYPYAFSYNLISETSDQHIFLFLANEISAGFSLVMQLVWVKLVSVNTLVR